MNNFSVQNPQVLKSYAQNVVRHLRNDDHTRAFENFSNLIKEGKDAPGYTRLLLNNAKYDNTKYLGNLVNNGELEMSQAFKRNKDTIFGIAKFWQHIKDSAIDKDFKLSFAKFYPKTAQHRIAIETFLQEGTGELMKCSHKKLSKKILFFFLNKF